MLIGEYTHKLDSKNRLSLPSKFRRELGKTIVVTRGLEKSLFVYSKKEWGKISEKLTELGMGSSDKRSFTRFFLGGATEVGVDSVGRILIPDFLKSFAGLKTNVVLAGVGSRVEVWDAKEWKSYKDSIERKADSLAERLGEVGAL